MDLVNAMQNLAIGIIGGIFFKRYCVGCNLYFG